MPVIKSKHVLDSAASYIRDRYTDGSMTMREKVEALIWWHQVRAIGDKSGRHLRAIHRLRKSFSYSGILRDWVDDHTPTRGHAHVRYGF